jgi:hypothetical protein
MYWLKKSLIILLVTAIIVNLLYGAIVECIVGFITVDKDWHC